MPLAYIRPMNPPGELLLVEIIPLSPGTPPERPQPQPPLGIWGPPDMPPGFWGGGMGPGVKPQPPGGTQPPLGIWGPTDPRPGHPISGIPGLPGYEPPTGGPGPGPSPGPGVQALVLPIPPSDPPTPPPAGIAPGSTQVMIWFGPGTKPAAAWVAPYPSQGPVPPPESAPAP
jgi:hypothetical protein